jgi:hypothetical protein
MMLDFVLNLLLLWGVYIYFEDLYIMLYSARSRKTGVSKANESGSKNSKDSNVCKSKNKIYSIS